MHNFPISIKGIVARDGKVFLLKNERDEWELPGGKLEFGERPEVCVVREVEEELGLEVEAGDLLDVWVYRIRPDYEVFIVTFTCKLKSLVQPRLSDEHSQLGHFSAEEVLTLKMPDGYKESIKRYFNLATP